jgi:succinate dehydrogenase/fumarate reductase flavoprotein subunit
MDLACDVLVAGSGAGGLAAAVTARKAGLEVLLEKSIESSKHANNAKKTESVSDRTVCSNLKISDTSVTQKILKN